MGSGKSTQGRSLAKAFQVEAIDLDRYIENKLNKTVPKIFDEFGETFFREQESIAIKELLELKKDPCIISLGGGAICFNDNLKLILENGLVIYLHANEKVLTQRLINSKNERPLLKGKSEEELLSFVKEKIKEREMYYDQAHIKVNTLNLTTALLIEVIEKYYQK